MHARLTHDTEFNFIILYIYIYIYTYISLYQHLCTTHDTDLVVYFNVALQNIRSSQVKSGQVEPGRVSLSQSKSVHFRSNQAMSGQVCHNASCSMVASSAIYLLFSNATSCAHTVLLSVCL